MRKLGIIIFGILFSFWLFECTNSAKDSYDNILAINKQVWDSIGWKDNTIPGVMMPFYKMVECNKPINFNDVNQVYDERYMDSSTWVLRNIHDVPLDAEGDFSWDWWFGRESILTRFAVFPITIKAVSWSIDEDHSIFMYYKCDRNDSLVPIDGYIFNWYGMPDISVEL